MQILKEGDKGIEVANWQLFLISRGYDVKADGDFGARTAQATRYFQATQDLRGDGIVGDATRAAAAAVQATLQLDLARMAAAGQTPALKQVAAGNAPAGLLAGGVRAYSDAELLARVRGLSSFKEFPANYWMIGVRSLEDEFNKFDDKLYLFQGQKFIDVWKATTNAGTDLLNPTNPRGEAVLKSDEIYYDSHDRRSHRGKVMAYCQRRPLLICRDNDRDKKAEELGAPQLENVGINIHPSSYIAGSGAERILIGPWSQGCQVFAIRSDFDKFMRLTLGQPVLTYCLLKEF